jgi:diguanylate cyclase (GGDEF)-like protein/PAS domain S-box-containing protein
MNPVYYRTDLEGQILAIDPSIGQYGYGPEDLIGRPAAETYVNPDLVSALIDDLKKTGVVCDYKIELKAKSGEVIDVLLDARLVYDVNGRPVGIEGVLCDAKKNEHDAVSREREEALRKLLTMLSRDIYDPLTGILGNISLLKEQDTTPDGREYLGEIEKYANEIRAALSTIRDLKLSLPSATNGKPDFSKTVTDIEKKRLEYSIKIITDQLTETFNRKFFDRLLEKELSRAQRFGYSITILMIALQNFDEMHNSHGPIIANRLLVEAANLLKSSIRNSDVLARDGESRFLILLPETSEEMSSFVIRRVRQKLQLRNESATIPMDFSIDSSSCSGQEGAQQLASEILEFSNTRA